MTTVIDCSETVILTIDGDLARVVIDNPPVNVTSRSVREGLLKACLEVSLLENLRAVLLSCAGKTFVAGGDVTEFDTEPMAPHLPDVIKKIEACSVPWVALLKGTVFGGGLEIAMGCRWRVASEDAKFALPEVRLGLIPGAGGTQRLPRLIDFEMALDMVVSGKEKTAHAMQEFGALDLLVPSEQIDTWGSIDTLAADQMPVSSRKVRVATAIDLPTLRQRTVQKSRGQLSPIEAFDAVAMAMELPFDEAISKERQTHLALRKSDQSRALLHIFFAERSTAKPFVSKRKKQPRIGNIAIVGGGLMGSGIAATAITSGIDVCLLETEQDKAEVARGRVETLVTDLFARQKNQCPQNQRGALDVSTDFIDATHSELAIEAVFENTTTKAGVFRKLAAVMPAHSILATNTSYLDPREIFEGIENSARCVGLHFFSPAHLMQLVEIVGTGQTSEESIAKAFGFVRQLGKIGVYSGVCEGFIGNRILAAVRRQADFMLADGATPEQVDEAIKNWGMPLGPYALQDRTGLNLAWAVRQANAGQRDKDARYVPIADRLCELERFGKRSGGGWYDYDTDGKALPSKAVVDIIRDYRSETGLIPQSFSTEEIAARYFAVMVNEAALIVEEGIARSFDDIDVVKVLSYGFPRHLGGPIHWARATGMGAIAGAMQRVARQSHSSWTMSKLLSKEKAA